jgi:hypothetical protein
MALVLVLSTAILLTDGGTEPAQPSPDPLGEAVAADEPTAYVITIEEWVSPTDLLLISDPPRYVAGNVHFVTYDPITLEVLP